MDISVTSSYNATNSTSTFCLNTHRGSVAEYTATTRFRLRGTTVHSMINYVTSACNFIERIHCLRCLFLLAICLHAYIRACLALISRLAGHLIQGIIGH